MGTIFSIIYFLKNKGQPDAQKLMQIFGMGIIADLCILFIIFHQ